MTTVYIILYNIIMYIFQPLIWIRLLWLSKKFPEYRQNWLERYGFMKKKSTISKNIIIHAVSLGETLSAIPLIHDLKKNYPDITIILTSMSPSGLKCARKFADNEHIQCMYLPYDLPGSMKRFINIIQPKLVIIIEKELWPNLINILYLRKIPLIIANARLSNQSFIKYKRFKKFVSIILTRITIIVAQHKEDASRFLKLGLKKNQLIIINNLKFDITINNDVLKNIKNFKKKWINKRFTWIASSTHPGEEKLILYVHKKLLIMFPQLLLILAPRHPNRFVDIINIIKNAGFSYITKSSGKIPTKDTQIIINDTIGELMLLYGISDIAFIGGSLIKHGGHNPLEPAIYAIPLIVGPYTFNFHDIYTKLHKLNGLIKINNSESLIDSISNLLKNKKLRSQYGHCAAKIFNKNRGTSQQLLKLITNYIPDQIKK